ncbi:mucin-binding protein [Limosilactobacillus mucosae]|uniref:mucin-binding protein n=1 Tax=Limosilactobacillus mucosae TaxID=97478 RepID=UPI00399626BB
MYSKNNKRLQELKMADGRQRFSLRRLNVGTVSVLIGTIFFFGAAGTASADTVPTDTSVNVTTSTDQTSSTDSQSVVLSKTASASDASTVVNSASASAVSDNSSLASSASTASTSVNTADLLSSATVTNSTAVSASTVAQSLVASPQTVNTLATATASSEVEIPKDVARNYAGVAWSNYTAGIYSDSKYYSGKSITNGVLNISSTDPLPDNWTTTLKQPDDYGVPVPKFSDSDSKTYYTFANVKDISNNTEIGSYVATKNLTDDQLIVTYFEKTGDTYVQKDSVQLTQGQTTKLGSVSIEYPSSSKIIMTPNDSSSLQLTYHYTNTQLTSPSQKVTFSVPTYTDQTIEFIDLTTGKNVFATIKRNILVGSQYTTVPFSAAGYEIIAPSNDSGTVSTSNYGGKGSVYTGTTTTSQGVVVKYTVTITGIDGTASISAQAVYNGKTNDLLINDGKTSSKAATGIKPGQTVDIIVPSYETSTGTSTNGTIITIANSWKPNTRNIVYYYKQIITIISQPTTQTVIYQGAGDANPPREVQDYTIIGELNEVTHDINWYEDSHIFDDVDTPVVNGYYADKAVAPGQLATLHDPDKEVIVTYKPLGKIIPVDENHKPISGATTPTYNNNQNDPTQATTTTVPEIPGYTATVTKVTPDDPGLDTEVVYTPIVNEVTVPTSQTVKYEGAGDLTPKDNVQNGYIFTGKNNKATGKTTWDEEEHSYDSVDTPVVNGYYANAERIAGQTVTPDHPNAEVTVTYKPLGKIIPVDSDGNPIPGVSTPTYNNDKKDPTKIVATDTPDIPGYQKSETSVTPDDPGSDTEVVYTQIITQEEVPTSQTVKYEGAGDQTPGPNVQNDFTFYKMTNEATGVVFWNVTDHTYDSVNTPVVEGYYADVASVEGKTVTHEQPNVTVTVTYKPLGKIIPVDENHNPISGASTPTYNNDEKDPTKATTTTVPEIPGYTATVTEVTPDNPGSDTEVVYTPIIKDATLPTSQTVKYEGAGDLTPKDNVQNNYTFTGKSNEATGKTTWDEETHAYKPVTTPVVEGYYADTAVVPGQTVTHDQPNAEVTVTYKPLGKIIPVDSDGNLIPGAETPTYENDPDDPTKATTTKTPDIKGYEKSLQEVTPDNPGEDTKVTYTPIIKDATLPTSQTVKYEGAGDLTPKDNVQNDYTFTGKSNEATGQTTWNEKTHAYKPVKTPVVEGYYADVASVDNIVLTPEHPTEEVTVKYRALGRIVPVDPEGNVIPNAPMPTYSNDPSDPTKTTTTPVPKVPGYTTTTTEVTPDDPSANTQITYTPIIKDATLPTSQTVKYEGAGDLTPKDNVQNDYTFTGKSNEATNVTTWDEANHAYKPVKTPVVEGYYADVASVDNIVLTPEHPTEEVTVKYRALGRIVPVDPEGNVIPNAPMPTYNNDPSDPTKTTTTPVPDIPGYTTTTTEVTPDDPSANTQITYTPIINEVTVPTSQTVKYEGAGDLTPKDNVQNDYTFTGKSNEATGKTTWNEKTHAYKPVKTPVIPGYYADIASVDGAEVTPNNPNSTITVTYKPMGKIVPIDSAGNPIPGAETPTYKNDSNDPTKATTTETPNIKGYNKSESSVTPTTPDGDTPVVYTPIISTNKVPSSQIINYVGAGDQTPNPSVQNDFTFTSDTNETTGQTTWNAEEHTYKSVETPVVPGYYADIASVDGAKVTPDNPTSITTVIYHRLGQIIPVDPEGNTIPNAPTPTYNNDQKDPSKGTTTPVPKVPGYTTTITDVTPDDPGANTQITYTPIIKDATVPTSQTVKYEGAGDLTPKDNVQNDYTFTGKSNEATGQTTWDEATHAYKPVTTPVIPGYYADVASVDNIVLTPEHPTEEVTVKYRALGRIVPIDPEGNVIPNAPMPTYSNDPSDPTKTTTTPVPKVPGYTTTTTEVTPDDPSANTQITYTPIINEVTVPTSQTVKYEGAGDLTPAESIQNDYTFTGEKNEATGEVTWTEQNHSYQGVPTPVIPGYYADIEHVAGAEVTPDNPVSTTIVTYHKLGSLIPVDSNGNPIPNAPTPTYNNDPNNPTQGFATPVPDIPGYKKTVESITPNDPGSDTKIVYVPIKSDDNGTVPSNPGSNTPTGPEQPSSENGNGTVTNEHQTDNQSTTSSTTENNSQNQSNQTNNQSTMSSATENNGQNQSNQTNNQSTMSSATENNGQNQSTQAQSLPQTGNDQQEAKGLISLGIASFLGMLGLMGYKKKQEH